MSRNGPADQGIDAQEQGAGLGVRHVEDFHVHFYVGIEIAAEVAVDELEPSPFALYPSGILSCVPFR